MPKPGPLPSDPLPPESLPPQSLAPDPLGGLPEDAPATLCVPTARAGLRADDYLALELPFLSRSRVRQKIQMGESLLNGRRYASSARLREGDRISILWRGRPALTRPRALTVLYEDAHLVALDKPAGMASHPVGRTQSDTLIQIARLRYLRQTQERLCRGERGFYPCLVHRLDVQTSGVILVAKTREALLPLQAMAARGEIVKGYVAVVEGVPAQDVGRIELPLGRDEESAVGLRMRPREDGRPAVTDFQVVRRLTEWSVLHVFPRTGRQHQVRVHLAAIGHPVWGDLLYKDERLFLRALEAEAAGGTPLKRHLLHAVSLSFTHPLTGKRVETVSALPEDFLAILQSLGG